MNRIRVGDQVVVIRGVGKGRRGKVTRVLPERGLAIVEGVRRVKRHVRATPQRPGGILEVEAPVQLSKLMPIDPETGKPTRVKIKVENGKKVRVAKSGAVLPAAER
ncbi:MAG: 50S ribosomal protein L24 [Pseudomonadota bacterium]|nr:MAG: 50S ribosomal protein L24 [Pseudomonadota bacterium]